MATKRKLNLEDEDLVFLKEFKKDKQHTEPAFKLKRSRYSNDRDKKMRLSRSQIEAFLNCPTCFYKMQKLGHKLPPSPGFSLNIAVDHLVKQEFNIYRENKTCPPICLENGIDNLIPFSHKDMDIWTNSFKGVSYYNHEQNIEWYGGIDDCLVNKDTGELHMVDTKATSKQSSIDTLQDVYNEGKSYKRQLEIYAYLFEKNGFNVSSKGFLMYYNADKTRKSMDLTLHFKRTLVHVDLDWSWIEQTTQEMFDLLEQDYTPELMVNKCNQCTYVFANRQKSID